MNSIEQSQKSKQILEMIAQASESELTIYKNAVDNQISKRDSSSSEEVEMLNSSDEVRVMDMEDARDILIDQFIADAREKNDQQPRRRHSYVNDGQQPGTSRQQNSHQQPVKERHEQSGSPEEKANWIICDAKNSRARIHQLQGKEWNLYSESHPQYEIDLSKEFMHSAMVDENYHLVGSHVDSVTQDKIVKGEYVDFAKLVPKDRILTAEDHRFEMIVKEGRTYWVPANEREGTNITSYSRWEQAFRLFSEIYMKAHPYRSEELVQYNHLIHLASQNYIWDNVYLYDKDFRIHMSKHPTRSWSIILQQAWAVRLRDKLRFPQSGSASGVGNGQGKKQELCKQFNRTGHCTFGSGCKFEHRCSYCFKYGHGVCNCRKLKADREGGRRHSGYGDRRHRSCSRSRSRYESSRKHSSPGRFNSNNNNNNNGNSGGAKSAKNRQN